LFTYQNNYVKRSVAKYQKNIKEYQKIFYISLFLRFQQNYFQIHIRQNFRSLSKIVLSMLKHTQTESKPTFLLLLALLPYVLEWD